MNLEELDVAARLRRLPSDFEEAWRREGLCAVYLASSDGPIPRYSGDNALGRPLKIGVTVPFDDNTSRRMLEQCPYHDLKVKSRVWFIGAHGEGRKKAERMARLAKQYVLKDSDAIRRGWAHMAGDYDIASLEHWIFERAKELRIDGFNDLTILRMIDRVEREKILLRGMGAL